MRVLVLNAGSSSLKAAIVDSDGGARLATASEAQIGGRRGIDHGVALERVLERFERDAAPALQSVEALGHRIVHGGEALRQPILIDAAVEAQIAACTPLAPLHNPAALAVLRALRPPLSALPQVAVFDTAFHASMPEAARCYALPRELTERYGLRRFGFHGINHANVMHRSAEALGVPASTLRLVSCHLGAGGSVSAIAGGRSIDTSMGLTPFEGLVMASRAGDLDPGLLLRLARDAGFGVEALEELLTRRCGLAALAGTTDMALIERRAAAGEARAGFALEVYVHRLRRYIGAMIAVLGGADAIAFSGGIGEHSALLRERACATLAYLGGWIDPARNAAAAVTPSEPVARISTSSSALRLLVVAADEERAIAEDVAALLLQSRRR